MPTRMAATTRVDTALRRRLDRGFWSPRKVLGGARHAGGVEVRPAASSTTHCGTRPVGERARSPRRAFVTRRSPGPEPRHSRLARSQYRPDRETAGLIGIPRQVRRTNAPRRSTHRKCPRAISTRRRSAPFARCGRQQTRPSAAAPLRSQRRRARCPLRLSHRGLVAAERFTRYPHIMPTIERRQHTLCRCRGPYRAGYHISFRRLVLARAAAAQGRAD